MRARIRRQYIALLATVLIAGCSEASSEPEPQPESQTGSITVSVATTGLPLDPDGYTATASAVVQEVDVNGSVTLTGLSVGSHSVTLGGIASNCSVSESNPQSVTVVANETATVSFTLACMHITEDMTLLATDREGTVYVVDVARGEMTRLFVPVTDDGSGAMVSIGVISSMGWVWGTEQWWFGFGGKSECFGCVHTFDAATGVSTFLSDPGETISAVAGLAVHPVTGRVYTTVADGSGGLFELDMTTGSVSEVFFGLGDDSSGKGLTFSNDGLLYIGGSNDLIVVDLDTEVTTPLGVPALTGFPPSVISSTIRSMATRESDGTVFAISRVSRHHPSDLATVDRATAELTHAASSDEPLDGLAYIPTRLVEAVAPIDPSRIVFVSDRTGNLDVFTMDPHGGNLVQVTDDAADDDDPSLSPDRSQVAFASERDGNWELYVKNADGSGTPTRLTNTSDGEWDATYSPDGSRIAFLFAPVGTNNWDLYSMAADGADIVQLTDNSEYDANPAWSPDGSQIVFQSQLDADWKIYTTDATTLGTPVRLTQDQGINVDPNWPADGAKIAFSSDRSGRWEVWTMNTDGSGQVQVTFDGGDEPKWSADGTKIIFSRGRDGARNGDLEIYIMNADGSGIRPISNSRANDEEIGWR